MDNGFWVPQIFYEHFTHCPR